MSFKEKWNAFRKSPWFWTIVFAIMAVLLVVLDQVTKWLAQNALQVEGNKITVIDNFFYLALYHNTAVAFSIGEGLGVGGRVMNIIISIVMSAFFIAYSIIGRKKHDAFMKFLLMLLAAGAVGNLIDRAFYWENTVGFNGVIDLFQFYLGGGPGSAQTAGIPFNPFPTFNMADSYLVIGIILFIVYLIVDSIKNRDKEEDNPPQPINPMPKGELSSEKEEEKKENQE
ncbi:MAG: signal peptidase II [Bacilli bacterium]|nr:signal peptidase II [Bacilli bacterium]